MSDPNVIKLRLSLMGRPVRNYTFDKTVVSVGRDPESDVFVDNPGVSRDHFRLERTSTGEYNLVDLGSANGTFLNDKPVRTQVLNNNDVVRFGKYTLWVGYEQDRRALGAEGRKAIADTQQHTVILSRNELGNLLGAAKDKDANPPVSPYVATATATTAATTAMAEPVAAASPIGAIVIAFLIGAALGAGSVWLLLTH